MKRYAALVLVSALAACDRLDELQYDPPITGEQWCADRPCVEVGSTVLNEPLGTVLVFTLAALWVVWGSTSSSPVGVSARARGWESPWSWADWGRAGGVSFQAFSYELKCAGREFCSFTNGFEVGYSLTQAWSVSAMLIAVAIACALGRGGVL